MDLHLHTTYSDGMLTPSELVGLCAKQGLLAISITDHDSTEGIYEGMKTAESYAGLSLIPGVELSTEMSNKEVHLLGYFINLENSEFQTEMRLLREGRQNRSRDMVKKLHELGIYISWDRVQELSGEGSIGRPHIAQAMVEQGYVKYPRDAFDKYIGRTGTAYVGRVKLTPVEAIGMIIRAGGLPVMAHPSFFMESYNRTHVIDLKNTLAEFKRAGLVGIEVFYKNYTRKEIELFENIATGLDLVPCGGSDYHASSNPDEVTPGNVGPPTETLETLKSILINRKMS